MVSDLTPINNQIVGQGQPFLRFHLVPDITAILPVNQMTEVVNLTIKEVVPIPHMPTWVMGVYNWRGEILWMVDLGQFIGLEPLYRYKTYSSAYSAIIIHDTQQLPSRHVGTKVLGLVVNQLEDMEWCNPAAIQPPPLSAVNSKIGAFLHGYWLKSDAEVLVVLDGNSIIAGIRQAQVSSR